MKNHSVIFIVSILFLLSVSCAKKTADVSIPVKNIIKTVKVTSKNFEQTVSGFGYIRAQKSEEITAKNRAVIEKVWVKEGDKVSAGDTLFTLRGIYPTPELISIKSQLETSRAELDRQKKENERMKILVQSGVAYEKEKIKVYTDYKKAVEQYNAAKKKYDFYFSPKKIRAASNGYITSISKIAGNTVGTNEHLASIVNMNDLFAEINIFGSDADLIRRGQKAIILKNNSVCSGIVSYLSISADNNTGTNKIGIKIISDKKNNLFLNDFVKAEIIISEHKNSLSIPESALLNDNTKKVVLVKDGSSYKKAEVATGLSYKGYIEILKGLQKENEVVVKGGYELLNNDIENKIKIMD